MERRTRKWLPHARRISGTSLFMVGIVALPIPVVPGWLLIGVALYILSIDSPGMRPRVAALRVRHPFLNRVLVPLDRLLGHESPLHEQELPFETGKGDSLAEADTQDQPRAIL